jgi:hypothetical protein
MWNAERRNRECGMRNCEREEDETEFGVGRVDYSSVDSRANAYGF